MVTTFIEEALKKENQLINLIKSYKKAMVAFSGGVDSTYLMTITLETLHQDCKALFARGPMISPQEQKSALTLAEIHKLPVEVIDLNILDLQEFRDNPPERCYFCKKELFKTFLALGEKLGYTNLIEGTNASDTQDYRPGRKALQELNVKSPLLEVGLTKEEIRALSQRRNLITWNKPSMACLASRVPYGDSITLELLRRISQAEDILLGHGFEECRVRVHGDIARIEIPIRDFGPLIQKHSEIVSSFKTLGFHFITLDLGGLRSGSLNPNHNLREESQ